MIIITDSPVWDFDWTGYLFRGYYTGRSVARCRYDSQLEYSVAEINPLLHNIIEMASTSFVNP